MGPITSNDFLNEVLEAEAWKEVSDNESLSMAMLERFADKLDWEKLSSNTNVVWTVEGISRFADKILWSEFSGSCPDNLITKTTLRKFSGKWDWKKLSARKVIYNDRDLLDKFADKVSWGDAIDQWDIERPLEFLARFKQYIPLSHLYYSRLWTTLVKTRAKQLVQDVLTTP